jgi:hypothetical protein
MYDLTNVHVWADTNDYFFNNFMSPVLGGNYPGTIVLDVDTMTIDYFDAMGTGPATPAIEAILDAEHPCADY